MQRLCVEICQSFVWWGMQCKLCLSCFSFAHLCSSACTKAVAQYWGRLRCRLEWCSWGWERSPVSTMVKSLSARLNSRWGRKQAIKWGGGVCCVCLCVRVCVCVCVCVCAFTCVLLECVISWMCLLPHAHLYALMSESWLLKSLEWRGLFVRAYCPIWVAAARPTKPAPPGWQRVACSWEAGCLAHCLVWLTNATHFGAEKGGGGCLHDATCWLVDLCAVSSVARISHC